MDFGKNDKLLFISPHFDDAILSCSFLMHKSVSPYVLTVFTASPGGKHFGYNYKTTDEILADKQVAIRAEEDKQALTVVGAKQGLLNLIDSCYCDEDLYTVDFLALKIKEYLGNYSFTHIFVPLGIYHKDHILISNAVIKLILKKCFNVKFYFYEELPYVYYFSKGKKARLKLLLDQLKGLSGPLQLVDETVNKTQIFGLYKSQFKTIASRPHFHDAMINPEIYYEIMG